MRRRARRLSSPPVNYAQLLFPDFSLIACGWLLCRYTALDRRVWDQVESLVYYFLFPVLLFHSIVRSPLDFGATSSLLGAGVRAGPDRHRAGLCAALPALARPRTSTGATMPRSAQVAFRFNSFICLALAERLAGAQGLLLIAVLIGVCVPLFNIAAVWPMARHAQTGFAAAAGAQPADHRHGRRPGRQRARAAACRPGWSRPSTRIGAASLALGPDGRRRRHAVRARWRAARCWRCRVLAIRHLVLPLVGLGAGARCCGSTPRRRRC